MSIAKRIVPTGSKQAAPTLKDLGMVANYFSGLFTKNPNYFELNSEKLLAKHFLSKRAFTTLFSSGSEKDQKPRRPRGLQYRLARGGSLGALQKLKETAIHDQGNAAQNAVLAVIDVAFTGDHVAILALENICLVRPPFDDISKQAMDALYTLIEQNHNVSALKYLTQLAKSAPNFQRSEAYVRIGRLFSVITEMANRGKVNSIPALGLLACRDSAPFTRRLATSRLIEIAKSKNILSSDTIRELQSIKESGNFSDTKIMASDFLFPLNSSPFQGSESA